MQQNSDIITIPEVRNAIAASLHLGDLANCIVVCRAWHDAFVPLIWRNLTTSHTFKLAKKGSHGGLASYGHYIRKLSIHPPEKLQHFIPYCHNVVELHVHDISDLCPPLEDNSGIQEPAMHNNSDGVSTEASLNAVPLMTTTPTTGAMAGSDIKTSTVALILEAAPVPRHRPTFVVGTVQRVVAEGKPFDKAVQPVVRMVAGNPSLTTLDLRVWKNIPFSAVYEMIQPVACNLRSLVVHYTDKPPTMPTSDTIRELLDKCPNLETFSFRADTIVSLEQTHRYWIKRLARWREMQAFHKEQQFHTSNWHDFSYEEGPYKLRELSFSFNTMEQPQLPFFYTLLQLCPDIRKLVVPDNPFSTLPVLERVLHDHLPHLTSLDLTYYGFNFPPDDHSIAQIIRATQPNQLRDLKTWGSYDYETFQSLAENQAQSIQVIEMGGYRGQISSIGVQNVLSSCPKLKTFKTGGHIPRMGFLLAQDILRSEWVCKDLEVLEVPIGGVCRFADGQTCPRHPIEPYPEVACRAIQRNVYRQLGKMVNLRDLDVHMYNYSTMRGPQCETLEWSLASGLAETIHLKRLNSFKFFGTNHAIGIPELEWMREHWTSLTELSFFSETQKEQGQWLINNWRSLFPFLADLSSF